MRSSVMDGGRRHRLPLSLTAAVVPTLLPTLSAPRLLLLLPAPTTSWLGILPTYLGILSWIVEIRRRCTYTAAWRGADIQNQGRLARGARLGKPPDRKAPQPKASATSASSSCCAVSEASKARRQARRSHRVGMYAQRSQHASAWDQDVPVYGQRHWVRCEAEGGDAETGNGTSAHDTMHNGQASMQHGHSHHARVPGQCAHAFRFKLMSYNILSPQYAQRFSSWLYKDVPKHCIPWQYRLPLLIQEITYWAPDVLCLQVNGRDGDSAA